LETSLGKHLSGTGSTGASPNNGNPQHLETFSSQGMSA
jgi:hypothetical protein